MNLTWRSALIVVLFVAFHATKHAYMPRPDPALWCVGSFIHGFCLGVIMGQWEKYHLDWQDRQAGQYLQRVEPSEET